MTNKDPEFQSTEAKRAEFERPYSGERILRDQALGSLFRERADTTVSDVEALRERGIELSPFLEIGAGSGQRSAALANNFHADGVATDISQNALRDMPFILQLLNYDRTPMRISCDAHRLPFLANSFRFVFAYQSLHHFNNPIPVLAECHRVLGKNGCLFFNEEPLDSGFRRKLRGRRMLSHPPTRIQKIGYRLGVEKIFWDDGALERSLGMTEARFDIDLWRAALKPFAVIEIEVNRKLRIHTRLRVREMSAYLSGLIGGNVKGICMKASGEAVSGDFRKRLICLDCNEAMLSVHEDGSVCANCGRVYQAVDGVIRMLPKELEAGITQ